MNSFKAVIKKNPEDKFPTKWTPIIVHGVDMGGNNAELLGFLWDRKLYPNLSPTHIVGKMPGYRWYYNQYNGTQYSPTSVHIYTVHAFMEFDDRWEFEVDLPWDEPLNKERKKK